MSPEKRLIRAAKDWAKAQRHYTAVWTAKDFDQIEHSRAHAALRRAEKRLLAAAEVAE